MRITRRPAIVMARYALKYPGARFRLAKLRISPRCGKCTCQASVVGVRYQPPSALRLGSPGTELEFAL